MNKNNLLLYGFLCVLCLLCFQAYAQNSNNFWRTVDVSTINFSDLENRIDQPKTEVFYTLDLVQFKNALHNVPDRKNTSAHSDVIVSIPNASGKLEQYQIFSAAVLDEELQNKYPELGSYVGKSVSNPAKLIRFSISQNGIKSITLNDVNGTEYIEPVNKEQQIYSVFYRHDLPDSTDQFECGVVDDFEDNLNLNRSNFQRNANDGQLREFRLALGCTEQYAAYHVNQAGLNAGTDAQKKAAVLAVMNDVMTRVNAVYENEISVTMILVPTNENVIFLSSPFLSNNNLSDLIDESQQFIDAFIGSVYDIGHMLCTGPGGLAQLFSPCTSNKARGVSGSGVPAGVGFEGIFMHELGHQYGSRHTFNGSTGSCTNNRSADSAYEPGSGTTIMAYPGICGAQNVQNNRDLYFHQKSLESIWANISGGPSNCATTTPTNNAAPVSDAGLNYIIPIGTPYKLTGSSSDPDGNETLTYAWEQYDLGPAGIPTVTTSQGPLVRSYLPSISPERYVPRLPDVLANGGTSTQWEQLPVIERSITYRFTVRDNDIRGGNNAFDVMNVSTVSTGFFRVISQNTVNLVYDGGSTQPVIWDVAGTTGSGIDTNNVNILLSVDGGQNFDIVLKANTPNDGNEAVTLPNLDAAQCRIMIEAVNNIFFNVNLRAFQIQEQLSIDDNQFAQNIKIYPNPNNGTFNLKLSATSGENIDIKLFDIRGRKIYSENLEGQNEIDKIISVNNLNTGMYLLKVNDGNREATKKIIIQ